MKAVAAYAARMALAGPLVLTAVGTARAAEGACAGLPSHAQLKAALTAAVSAEASGLNNHMWATAVNRDGVVCAVAFSGTDRSAQWPISRVISAQKASQRRLPGQGLVQQRLGAAGGTGPLHREPLLGHPARRQPLRPTAQQPRGPGGGLQGPGVGLRRAQRSDGGRPHRGVNVFGGGLGLYNAEKKVVGGVGVSGDTSCADHNIAWRVRHELGMDNLAGVGGVSGDPTRPDNIVFDITPNPAGGVGNSTGGFGHPQCPNTAGSATLPVVR